jgi:hypothetical protein
VDSRGRITEIEFQGPQRFGLTLEYTPEADMFLRQVPAMARLWTRDAEAGMQERDWQKALVQPWRWALLVPGLVLLLVARARRGDAGPLMNGAGWTLIAAGLGAALVFVLRGVFGFVAAAAVLYVCAGLGRLRAVSWVAIGGGLLLFVGVAAWLDTQAEGLFNWRSTLELDTTPVTPAVLTGLGVAAVALWLAAGRLRRGAVPAEGTTEQAGAALPAVLATALVLLAFSLYDALQQSLSALLLLLSGLAFLAYRLPRSGQEMSGRRIAGRLELAWKSRVIPIGIGLMALFAAQNGLQRTAAVLGPAFGPWEAFLPSALLLLSITLVLVSVGVLFIVLYPLLPSHIGYVRAAWLALFLLVLFAFGIGGDARLVASLEELLFGRLVLYLGVPLIIGMYFDLVQTAQAPRSRDGGLAEGGAGPNPALGETWKTYVRDLRGQIGTVGALASVLAPGVYSFVTGSPLLATQFDLIDRLLSLPLAS